MFKPHTCTNIITSLYAHVIMTTPIFRGRFNNAWNKFSICMNVNKFRIICGWVLLHLKYALDPYVLSLMWSWITICTHPPTRGTLPTHKPKQHVQTQAERNSDSPDLALFHLACLNWIVSTIGSRLLCRCQTPILFRRELIIQKDIQNGGNQSKTFTAAVTAVFPTRQT